MGDMLDYTALEDTAAAVEAERRRLAELLHGSVVESLNLLLAQAHVYEQTLGADPPARLAVSVLASLARQALQQTHDLATSLHPTILETLGLEPALEDLVSQATRVHGLQITLTLARLHKRLPAPVELALFRAAQDALDRAARHAHASQVTVRLTHREDRLVFTLTDDGVAGADAGRELLRAACQRLEQLGGVVEAGPGPQGGFALTVSLTITAPAQLTPREMAVLQLLCEGLSNKEIAQRLVVSPRTVNFHLDHIYAELGVRTRTGAVLYALRQGWVRRTGPDPG